MVGAGFARPYPVCLMFYFRICNQLVINILYLVSQKYGRYL